MRARSMVCGDWWACVRCRSDGNTLGIGPIAKLSACFLTARCGRHSGGASRQNRRDETVRANLALVPTRWAVILLAS